MNQSNDHKSSESLAFLKRVSEKIPAMLRGLDKQMFIAQKLMPALKDDQILVLRGIFNDFLMEMRRRDASDIDAGGWGSNGHVWMRIHGDKAPVSELGKFSTTEMDILIQGLLMENQRKLLLERRNIDFSYNIREGGSLSSRYRADAYFETNCLAMNMRAINAKIFPVENYNFHNNVTKSLSLNYTKEGLILVTGITGSGKSTTLDSIVDMNNRTAKGHIVIIASPVEFVHNSQRCLVRHREVGRDTLTFKSGTIEALRQDPDIIVIGEMRDPDTIMAALEAADSGHKVLSTMHTSSAVESLERIVAEMPTGEQERVRTRLADTLKVVVSQKLVPAKDGKRVLAKEILLATPSVRAAILNNNVNEIYQMISQGGKIGMHSIEQDLAALLLNGKISMNNAVNFANNKRRLEQILQLAKQEQGHHA